MLSTIPQKGGTMRTIRNKKINQQKILLEEIFDQDSKWHMKNTKTARQSFQTSILTIIELNLVPVEHCYIETVLANNFLDLFFYSLSLWNPQAKRQLHHLHSETHNSNDLALPKSI